MRFLQLLGVAFLLSVGLVAPVSAQTGPPTPKVLIAEGTHLGNILVDGSGWTLYRFTRDEPNTTNCYEQCAQAWPPFTVAQGEPVFAPGLGSRLGVIPRSDGTLQVVFDGVPLYYFAGDAEPGDTKGQGVGGAWSVIETAAQPGTAEDAMIAIVANADHGRILVDGAGWTLYRFTQDGPNISNCYDACAEAWPPLLVAPGEPIHAPGLRPWLGAILRHDGTLQVAFDGMPLYYFAHDTEPGATSGHGAGGVWFVVEPVNAIG